MSTIQTVRQQNIDAACRIDGWLTPKEAAVLYDLARNADGAIIEIGSWQGRSTAALALGSMAGKKATVHAIDPFIGPQEGSRTTSLGSIPDCAECSPARLRANLDSVGINGAVRIVPKASQDAIDDVPPECSLLFIDGAHDYASVCRDFANYLPRVKVGGYLVIHDVSAGDMGVVRAVEDKITTRADQWRRLDHIDSALVLKRVNTPSFTVALLCPGRGFDWGPLTSVVQATLGAHRIDLDNNGNGWDDFNTLWARVLNKFEAGGCTHAAMLHSDITASAGWIDILADDMHEMDLDLISVGCAVKDHRAVLNGGIGSRDNRWGSWRRLTVKELLSLPPTFGFDDLAARGFCGNDPSDKVLLHNTGCWLADLRKPCFRQTYEDDGVAPGEHHTHTKGDLRAWFDFPTKIRRDEKSGLWMSLRESEDWFFSRQLFDLGAKTRITRKVRLKHEGKAFYTNDEPWGNEHDDDNAHQWRPEAKSEITILTK